MDFSGWLVWRKGQTTTPSVCHWTWTLTEPWQVLFLPPSLPLTCLNSSLSKQGLQCSNQFWRWQTATSVFFDIFSWIRSCQHTLSYLRKSFHCCHQSPAGTQRRAIYAITHVLYQALLPVTKHNEEWPKHTYRAQRRSSLPAKTYSERMWCCNNIGIHLGWYC